jgi:hypothetical protein
MELYNSFAAWADVTARGVVAYAHPGFSYDARVTKGWAGTGLHQALIALSVYVVIVIVGLVKRANSPAQASGAVKSKDKSGPRGVALLLSDPLRMLMAIYNLVQVRLSTDRAPRTAARCSAGDGQWGLGGA